jgi:hypothetical protein
MWVVGPLRGHEFERIDRAPFPIDARQAEARARRHPEEPGITTRAGAFLSWRPQDVDDPTASGRQG